MPFLNDVKFTATTSGLADFGIGAAVDGFQTPAEANAIDGVVYSWTARKGAQFESFRGAITAGVLARTTVLDTDAGFGVKVNFASAPTVVMSPLADDFREKLTADTSYWVDNTTGSNSNPGTEALPFATLTYAWDYLSGSLDLGQFALYINLVASATPYSLNSQNGWIGGAEVVVLGAGMATTTVDGFTLDGEFGTTIIVGGVKIEGGGIQHNGSGLLKIGGPSPVDFGAVAEAHIQSFSPNARIEIVGDYTISGGANCHFLLGAGASLLGVGTCTVTGTPNFAEAFLRMSGGAVADSDVVYTGAATGVRFLLNDAVATGPITDTLTTLPGDQPGVIGPNSSYGQWSSERRKLQADAEYVVDNVNGTDEPGEGPFLTLNYAWEYLSGVLDLGQNSLTFSCAASATAYSLGAVIGFVGGDTITIIGAGTTTTTLEGTEIVCAITQDVLNIEQLKLNGFGSTALGKVKLTDVHIIGGVTVEGFGCELVVADNITLEGNADFAFRTELGGHLTFDLISITGVGTPAYAGSFAICKGGIITGDIATLAGFAATGRRFEIESNGVISVEGGEFPGDQSGIIYPGGVYVDMFDPDGQTVADLQDPATLMKGFRAWVTDSTVTWAAGLGEVVVGGGANEVPVTTDRTNWRIG